jgi:mycothiol synthase
MSALEWRPMVPADAGRWSVLHNCVQQADGGHEFLTEQDLSEEFDDPTRDYAHGSVAICDGPDLAGYGLVSSRAEVPGPVHQMRYEGGVHPAYRGRGLGGRLLDWAGSAAASLHAARGPRRPLALMTDCLTSNTGAMALFAAHGYQQVRWFHEMSRTLTAPLPAPASPPGVTITPFTPDRTAEALAVRNDAFRDHWGAPSKPAEAFDHWLGSAMFRPAFSFMADADGEPAGIILCQEYAGVQEFTGVQDLYIAVIGTRPASRKRGIASALLARAMAEGRDQGFASASLTVDADSLTGALALYERAGFSVRHTTVRQRKQLSGEWRG